MTSTVLMAAWLLCLAWLVSAPAVAAADYCDRARRYETLSPQDQQTLQRGAPVVTMQTHTGSAYQTGYVYRLVPHPAELVMAVFSAYEEQRDHISGVLEARVEEQRGNYARVRFVYDLPWPLPNSEYVVNDTVVQEGVTYLLYWNLHPSSPGGMSAPKYVEGYFRTQPVGSHALMMYCNYLIPGTALLPGKVNSDGLQAMQTTVDDTMRWVAAVAASAERASTYLARLRQMLTP